MSEKKDLSLLEKAQSSFKQLSVASSQLNQASDELGKTITELDAALKSLNLGVSAWVTFDGGSDYDAGYYWTRELGYEKAGKQWGLALKTTSGYYENENTYTCDSWPFNEAPRWLRILGVEKIPELLDKLCENVNKTTLKIKQKNIEARELATGISGPAKQPVKK